MVAKSEPEKYAVGVIVIIASVFAMSCSDAVIKYVSSDLPLWQIYVVRSLIAIPMICFLFFFSNGGKLRPLSMKWTIIRSLCMLFMYIAVYAALPVVSLPVIAAAFYTGPLFITLFSAVIVKEPVGPMRWLAIFLGFIGVLIILRPGSDSFSLVMIIPVIGAILYATTAVITRTKCAQEKPLVLALAMNYALLFGGLVLSGLIALWQPQEAIQTAYPFLFGYWIEMGIFEWSIMLLLAILIVTIAIGLAKAYQSGPLAVIATFDYSYLIFVTGWSIILFSDWPDQRTIIGMLTIAVSGFIVTNPEKVSHLLYGRYIGKRRA